MSQTKKSPQSFAVVLGPPFNERISLFSADLEFLESRGGVKFVVRECCCPFRGALEEFLEHYSTLKTMYRLHGALVSASREILVKGTQQRLSVYWREYIFPFKQEYLSNGEFEIEVSIVTDRKRRTPKSEIQLSFDHPLRTVCFDCLQRLQKCSFWCVRRDRALTAYPTRMKPSYQALQVKYRELLFLVGRKIQRRRSSP